MLISPEDRLLIDRYLEGSLSGLELQQFMERLDRDASFRATVSLQNLLVEGIIRSADKELHKDLLESISYRKPRVPLGLKLIITFMLITVGGIVLWDYLGTDSGNRISKIKSFSWLSHSQSEQEAEENSKHPPESKTEKPKSSSLSKSKLDSNRLESGSIDILSELNSDVNDSLTLNEDEEEDLNQLVVKKDQLLIAQSLFILEDSAIGKKAKAEKQNTLSEEVAGKLSPAAGLEKVEKDDQRPRQILVEFWVSPINYKGYKMYRNKLVLFGMEEPDGVKLYRKDGKLYLKTLNKYFLIEQSEEFTSYQPVKDKEFSIE